MTREEEMWEAVEKEHGVLSRREAFVTLTAMKWADKTMIEKACEWLKDSLINYWSRVNADSSNFIKDFKKAMEDEV